MELFLIKALQLILSLSILVIIHECGHFLFARLFKVRVEKFYLFFNPWFSLFKYKPKGSDTEYGIGWLPLGGYVKIAGMIDESMDKEQMALPEQPWEFRSKPAGQRLLIMVGGVLFNFILAILIYSMITFTWGEKYIDFDKAPVAMEFSKEARDAGFANGDIFLSADGVKIKTLSSETLRQITEAKQVKVLRLGDTATINIPENFILQLKSNSINYRMPVVIDRLVDGGSAQKAGLMGGDSIVMIGNTPIVHFPDLGEVLARKKGEEVIIEYYRKGNHELLKARIDSTGKLGFYPKTIGDIYPTTSIQYGLLESIPVGIKRGVNTLTSYVGDMKYVFTKEGAGSVGGFGTLGSIFPPEWNWLKFWEVTAFLSVILAFMNILPIPALDGGHVLFLLYEVITRRKPNEKFMEYAQAAGMLLLFALLIYANGNDLFRFLFK